MRIKLISRWPLWAKIIINLLAMAVLALVIGWITMMWLGIWTHHDENVKVPEVTGMTYQGAKEKLEKLDLVAVITDSVYEDDVAPGTVIAQNPKVDNNVKPGREIYLTINAFMPKMVTVPALKDVSLRQARAALEAVGVEYITERRVPSEYQDLVLDATADGKSIQKGGRISIKSHVILTVGTNSDYSGEQPDSVSQIDTGGYHLVDENGDDGLYNEPEAAEDLDETSQMLDLYD